MPLACTCPDDGTKQVPATVRARFARSRQATPSRASAPDGPLTT